MPKVTPELIVIEKTQALLVWTLHHIEKLTRTANRNRDTPDNRNNDIGFRVVR